VNKQFDLTKSSIAASTERWIISLCSTARTTPWEIQNSSTTCVKRGTIRFCSAARTTPWEIQNSSTTSVEGRVISSKPTHSCENKFSF